MNGARALLNTLVGNGVDVCFANPGTSEMHFVAALDSVPGMRGVLCLFEGVATGAADGYARIAGKPAAALLHLGPGLGNGLANLHNARRALVPLLVVVGDHATTHKRYDSPLESDIDSVARTVSGWVHRTASPANVAADAAEAISKARAGQTISTLIVPADVSWSEVPEPTGGPEVPSPAPPAAVSRAAILDAAAPIRAGGDKTLLLLGGDATRAPGLAAAARISAATGARRLCETFPARWERGAGVAGIGKLAYFAEDVKKQLETVQHLVLAGARSPVAFFAHPDPGLPSDLVPPGCQVHNLAGPIGALAALNAQADEVAPDIAAPVVLEQRPQLPTGPLTGSSAAAVIGALLPQRAIVVDESNTSGGKDLFSHTAAAPEHDWLALTGGAIGYGMPAAIGVAIAAPERPVLSLEADGSAMYTISALWTQARENLDITTVIYSNHAYAILGFEMGRFKMAPPGPAAAAMLQLADPAMDFVKLAEGMGVPARRVSTAEQFAEALSSAFAEPGPHLIEAIVPLIAG